MAFVKKVKGLGAFRMICVTGFPGQKRSLDLKWKSDLERKRNVKGGF